jgi:hypothetical protein
MKVKYFGFAAFLTACFLLTDGCVSVPEMDSVRVMPEQEVSAAERAFLLKYVENLSYLVYVKDSSAGESALKDIVLRNARKYLPSLVTEEIKGEEAAVHIEFDIQGEGESRGENHYGTVFVRCTMIEPCTGLTLGVLQERAPRTFSKAGQFDAQANAAQAVLSVMIPEAAIQTRRLLLDLYTKGLFYELAVRAPESGKTRDFQKALASRVRNLRTGENLPSETRYTFTFFGFPEEAEKTVREAAGEAGMDGLISGGREGRRLVFGFK